MKTVIMRDNTHTVATLHQPREVSDKEFEELVTALLLTIANMTGRPIAREDVYS
jgi:hypothetical protein